MKPESIPQTMHKQVHIPQRIQRRRTKDWRMAPNTIYVGRGSKWGSPFRIFGRNSYLYCDASHRWRDLSPRSRWVVFDLSQPVYQHPATPQMVVEYCRRWIAGEFNSLGIVRPCLFTIDDIRRELGGWNLACWCGLDEPCHADVLLELANGESQC